MTRTLELLDRLIAFPTVSSESNLDLIDWAQDLLRAAGFEVTRIASPMQQKAGLFARIGPGSDGGVCLSGHTDVVPVAGQEWHYPAFKLSQAEGRLYGRGTADMKGFLAWTDDQVVSTDFIGDPASSTFDHGAGIVSRYAHNSRRMGEVGDEVLRGDMIATV